MRSKGDTKYCAVRFEGEVRDRYQMLDSDDSMVRSESDTKFYSDTLMVKSKSDAKSYSDDSTMRSESDTKC